jgi:PAS domain S-box-containing protein
MIDDDPDDVVLVRDVVRELAHYDGSLTNAGTFEAGLAMLLGPNAPDVCLLDLRLGERTGLELLREARANGSLVPIIVLTGGNSTPELDVEILRAGGSDYVMKHELTGSTLDRSIRYAIERARALDELRRSESRFRALIEELPHAIFVHRDGRFVYVNPTALRYLGHTSADGIVGHSTFDFVHEDERAALAERAQAIMAGGDDSDARHGRVMRLLRADGSHAHAELAVIRVFFDGTPALLTVARDVSAELEAKARLLLSDRRVAVGTLSAGVAHEINNPLAYVLSNVGFASEEIARRAREPKIAEALGETLESVLESLKDAKEGALRVEAIVRDLQSFSRGDDGARVAVDMRRVVQLAANLAENEVRHRARLIVDHGDVPPVDANEGRLSQVFLNLLLNAAQAIPDGAAATNEIRIASSVEGRRVIVRVTDSGAGIPPEILGRVFDPFFTTKPVDVGTGLGLFVSRNIIHAIGGELTVESTLGVGTTATVSLVPLTAGMAKASIPSAPVSSRRGRVMVIDDEPMVGSSLRRNLTKEHDVVVLTSAREGLELIEAGERYDVIFCDLMMPDMTGMDFYEAVATSYPALAPSIIFFTGGAFTPRASTFLDSVPNTRLEKPAEMEKIRGLLRSRIRP